MSFIKILTNINWLLIGVFGAFVVWALLQKANPANDAGGSEWEVAIKAIGVFMLLVLAGLNWLSYPWTKIVTFLIAALLLLLIRFISTN